MATPLPRLVEDLLELLLESDDQEFEVALGQRKCLLVKEVDYSGVGVFYRFEYGSTDGIQRLPDGITVWDHVVIISPKIPIGAEAILHSKDGYIDYLEIWAYGGYYPQEELTVYVLRQEWKGSTGRCIERR